MTRLSDIELSKKTGISSSTVGRRLTDKNRILKAFPDNGEKVYLMIQKLRKLNLANGKMLGAETTKMNYGSDEVQQKLNINVLGRTEAKQMSALMHLILTFRPKLALLSELFQIDEEELYDLIMTYAKGDSDCLEYIFKLELTDQDIAKEKIIGFYQDLVDAKNSKDEKRITEVWAQIDDSKFAKFQKSRVPNSFLTDDDIELVIEYQIKKFCGKKEACKTLGISCSQYKEKLPRILQPNHRLFSQYEQLSAYKKAALYGIKRS